MGSIQQTILHIRSGNRKITITGSTAPNNSTFTDECTIQIDQEKLVS